MRSMNTYTKRFLLALLIFVAFRVYPQKVITEFEFGNTSLDKLSGMIFNDSLFLGGELMSMGAPTVKVSYWVRKDGSKRKVDFSKLGGKSIFAVSATDYEEYYYYLVEERKSVFINALIIDSLKMTLTTKPLTEFGLSFVSVDTISSDGYVLTAGSSALIKPSTPLIHNIGLIGLLASAATQAVVRELSEGQRIYAYSHIKINLDGSLNFTTESNTLVQKIDDYEIQNFKEKMEYKGYLATVGSVFAFFKVKKSNKFQIVQFER